MTAPDERKWRKSNSDRMIGGVCGGLASYFHVDATLVRIVWAVSVFFNGLGAIAYLVAMLVLPSEETDSPVQGAERKSNTNIWMIAGILLILIGLSWGMHNWGWRHHFPFWEYHWFGLWHSFWPVLLILLGVLYLVYVHKERKPASESDGSAQATSKTWPFYRAMNDKVIGGVCGGLARAIHIDPTIVRIGVAVVALVTGVFFWAALYVIAVIVIPTE